MRILDIRPAMEPGGGAFPTLCYFDVEISPTIRLYGMRLVRVPDGRRISYAPSSGGRRFATFAPETAEAITTAAIHAFDQGQMTANDQRAA